ncbi:MAG: hypothetical protein Q4D04_13300, partial [Clostridia bacterium]|nr:hypothetical protein [Clostridia bacterium]
MAKYPDNFLSQMQKELGDEFAAFERALSQPRVTSLRLNPRRPDFDLGDAATGRVPWEKDGRYLTDGFRPGSDPLHFAGGYYMQEASAMAPANALPVADDEIALDLCA